MYANPRHHRRPRPGQHLYCIGASGAGKSTFLEGLMAQDLAEDRGFCFIDKHGDSTKRIADSSPAHHLLAAGRSGVSDRAQPVAERPTRRAVAGDGQHRFRFQRHLGLGTETPRLLHYLRASARLLLDTPGTTLLDIRPKMFRH
jgi:ABC-type phosphonate transport system ATPase subunit